MNEFEHSHTHPRGTKHTLLSLETQYSKHFTFNTFLAKKKFYVKIMKLTLFKDACMTRTTVTVGPL